MRNYAVTCKSICRYKLAATNFFEAAFVIKMLSFCDALFKLILAWERGISKR